MLRLWRYAVFLFLLIYIVPSTRNIFCLIKSFWLGFAGRPSWPSVLDKFKCNLHPRDPNLTAPIPPMLNLWRSFTELGSSCPVRWVLQCTVQCFAMERAGRHGDLQLPELEAPLPTQFNLVLPCSGGLSGATVIFLCGNSAFPWFFSQGVGKESLALSKALLFLHLIRLK